MFKLDQKGLSLPIALAIAAVIAANSYYFLVAQKNISTATSIVKTDLREEAEKRRLAAVLSDFNVCTANFGGKTMGDLKDITLPAPIASIVKEGTIVLEPGLNFKDKTGSPAFNNNVIYPVGGFNQTMKVGKIYFNEPQLTAAEEALAPPRQVRVTLRVEYDVLDKTVTSNTGKKVVISVPLYIEFDRPDGENIFTPDIRKVVRCYARPDNAMTKTGLFQAIEASCQPQANGSTNLTTAGCQHFMQPKNCSTNGYQFLDGISIDPTNNSIQFSCDTFKTFAASIKAECDPGKVLTSIKDSIAICEFPDPCPGGTTLLKIAGNGYACSQNCGPTDVWHSAPVTGTGPPECYERIQPCSTPGEYAQSISPEGIPDCRPITIKNKSCTATEFATHFDTLSSSTDVLHCAAFTKPRACTTLPKFSYITSLNTLTPSCMTVDF